MLEATQLASTERGFTARSVKAMRTFAKICEQWRIDGRSQESLTAAGSLADLVERVIREAGLEALYSNSQHEEDSERIQNLEELVSAAAEFEERLEQSDDSLSTPLQMLFTFLESVALVSDADAVDPQNGAVTLMTLHAAKGLEFPVVFIVGCEHDLIPLQYPGMASDKEEERRLFYVGMTRAKEQLYFVRAKRRMLFGNVYQTYPSPFLSEIEDQLKQYEKPEKQPGKRKKKAAAASQMDLFG